jgi:hypothetical protein
MAVVLIALCVCTRPARAWNRAGHMVSGAIAYEALNRQSPRTLVKVLELLRAHPSYERSWKARLEAVEQGERDVYLFMNAARWADEVRGNVEFDHPAWHYVNFSFSPDGVVKAAAEGEEDILKAFAKKITNARSGPTQAERAIALAWLFHLVGDVHQPLHACELVSSVYPQGDRGGNSFFVRARPGGAPISLHLFWDDLILGSERFGDVRNRQIELMARAGLAKEKLGELSEKRFEQWARAESYPMAVEVVYQKGKLAGSAVRNDAPVLPEGYAKQAQAVAERRIVLAGYRLAEVMGAVFP